MPALRKYPPELRERAMRLVAEARKEDPELSLNAAVTRIGQRVGVNPDTSRGWCKQAAIDAGERPGTTTSDAARIKQLEAENRELRRANEVADSTGGRNEFCELLRWCQIAERFARSSVERVLDRGQLSAGDDAQIGALRQVLA